MLSKEGILKRSWFFSLLSTRRWPQGGIKWNFFLMNKSK